jgi:hypothetical protein
MGIINIHKYPSIEKNVAVPCVHRPATHHILVGSPPALVMSTLCDEDTVDHYGNNPR